MVGCWFVFYPINQLTNKLGGYNLAQDTMQEPAAHIESAFVAQALRQALRQGQTAVLVVSSNSMAPLLWRGDEVLLTAVTTPQPGDILTYFDGCELMTHRYYRQAGTDWLLRGDRVIHPDPPIQPPQLVGKVVGRRRNGRLLRLDTGKGARLNALLAQLAHWEARYLLRHRAQPLALWLRLARRLLLAAAWLACMLVR